MPTYILHIVVLNIIISANGHIGKYYTIQIYNRL